MRGFVRALAAVGFIASLALAAAVAHADTGRFRLRFTLSDPPLADPRNPSDSFGFSIGLGDVDGDGVPDVIVPRITDAYVFSGATGRVLFTLTPPDKDTYLFFSSVAVGDVDGDGQPEIVLGSGFTNCGAGRVYVFSGRTGQFRFSLDSPTFNGQCGTVAEFGQSVALTKAANGPGLDIIVGAPAETVGGNYAAGRVYVFSGSTHQLVRTLTAPDPEPGAAFGFTVRVDGRGHRAILAVAAMNATVNGVPNAGRVYVFSRRSTPDFVIDNPQPALFRHFGAVALDVTEDGRGRTLLGIGAYNDSNPSDWEGHAYVFSGRSLLYSLDTPNPQTNSAFGLSLAFADLDGHGDPSLIVGAPLEAVDGSASSGRVYVFGANGRLTDSLTAPGHPAGGAFGFPVTFDRGSCSSTLAIGAPGDFSDGTVDVFAAGTDGREHATCR